MPKASRFTSLELRVIADCRSRGVSWSEIAAVLGRSPHGCARAYERNFETVAAQGDLFPLRGRVDGQS